LPILKSPFYAICTHGVSITSTVGLAVNSNLEVIDSEKKPIKNLFAAGEILGSGQTMGKCSAGGMMLTQALTFGKILGQKLLIWDK
jgi:fumarate reductase flavoprotein subunit